MQTARTALLGGWEWGDGGGGEKDPKPFHSHAIYLFSTVCLHIKCPGAKSNQLGGLLAALLGEVPELLPFPFEGEAFVLIYLITGKEGAPSPGEGGRHGGASRPPGAAEPGSAAPGAAAPPVPLRSQGTGQRRRRPRDRGHRSARPGTAGTAPPAPDRGSPAATTDPRREPPAPPPPVLTAGRLGQRGDRGLAHGSAGRRSRRPRGAQPPPRLLPRAHPGAGRARAPRRLAGGGCSGCGPAAAACHPAELPGHRRRPGPSPPPRSAPAPPRPRLARSSAGTAEVFTKCKN